MVTSGFQAPLRLSDASRYRLATLENPLVQRSAWTKMRPVESILSEACAEVGEEFKTFTRRVCHAMHERPGRIVQLSHRVRDLRQRLADGQFRPRG